MKQFIHKNFILETKTAETLYHDYAKNMPIIDYHNHLSPKEITENNYYNDIHDIWLGGDHYKWRAMRTNGVQENDITGSASKREKFKAWAATVPATLRNPLYHWTHLELSRFFGIDNQLLNEKNADSIYSKCNKLLQTEEYRPWNLLEKMNVEVLCTTDDPADSLQYHIQHKEKESPFELLPAWRPDKALKIDQPESFNSWIDSLSRAADIEIQSYDTFKSAVEKRHEFFHTCGCRISDYGLERIYAENCSDKEAADIFLKARKGEGINPAEGDKFRSAVMIYLSTLDAETGWVQQLHVGTLRNTNSRLFAKLGPDSGFDSMGDAKYASDLAKFLDLLDRNSKLAKTVIYPINQSDNSMVATMIGNFQDGSIAGKMQFGSAWWFLDQKDGMERHLNDLSAMGLLSRFIGMTTDSRSILSFVRHEYFRRILCNLIGTDIEKGLLPNDMELVGNLIKDVCYNNAKEYFNLS